VRDLAELMPEGVTTRIDLTLASSTSSVARWTASGDVLHVHPGVVMLPHLVDDLSARARAANLWSKGPISHASALELWDVLAPTGGPLHLTVPADRFPRRTTGVVVHRTTLPLPTTGLRGIHVTSLPRSLVDAWDWSHRNRRGRPNGGTSRARQAVIESLRSRRTDVVAVRRASMAAPVHAGRPQLMALLDLVADGCESELEVWGVTKVLPGPPRMPQWVQQYVIRLGNGRSVRLDAAYPEARVAVELDGAAFHGSREARERDLRRDTALAALGWVVLRFSYARATRDPEGCRREIEAVVLNRMP
jgi:predicted transcriptional regulator of viral defense system